MARAFSSDLRKRAVNKEGSSIKVAEALQVSSSFVRKVRLRFDAEGTVEARPHGGGPERKVTEEAEQQVREILREREDIILEDLAQELFKRCGVSVSKSCMCKALKRMGISRKKKRFMPVSETLGACSSLAMHTER
jgi:transposase